MPTWKQKVFCYRHFVSGRPAENRDRFNVDWVPTLKATAEWSEGAKAQRKSAIKQQEQEATKKRKIFYRKEKFSIKAESV